MLDKRTEQRWASLLKDGKILETIHSMAKEYHCDIYPINRLRMIVAANGKEDNIHTLDTETIEAAKSVYELIRTKANDPTMLNPFELCQR